MASTQLLIAEAKKKQEIRAKHYENIRNNDMAMIVAKAMSIASTNTNISSMLTQQEQDMAAVEKATSEQLIADIIISENRCMVLCAEIENHMHDAETGNITEEEAVALISAIEV